MSSTKSFRKEEIAGKTVIDSSGVVVGKVKDLTFTLEGVITLVVEKSDSSEARIPLSKVMGVSDHVIVKQDSADFSSHAAPTSEATGPVVVCRSCGARAKVGTAWCPACGRSLG